MPEFGIDFIIDQLIYLGSILLAVVLGFAIGFERKLRFKEAGIRTHTIVCAGAALIMVVSKYGFTDMGDFDASRVAAQIVSGIGFLGAGMIIYRRQVVHGLTTAAGVWATAGVGMAAGCGLYIVAIGATVILICVQCILHTHLRPFRTKIYMQIKVCFEQKTDENKRIQELFGVQRFTRLNVVKEGEKVMYMATLSTAEEFSSTRIGQIMAENAYIRSIERCDDDR